MEVNITIFIQALIFLMLFLFLSNVLFKPLKNILQERNKYTLDEKIKVNLIYKEIKQQDIYINQQISITLKKAKKLYVKNMQDILIKETEIFNNCKIASQKKHKEILSEIQSRKIIIAQQLHQNVLSIATIMYEKLYNK